MKEKITIQRSHNGDYDVTSETGADAQGRIAKRMDGTIGLTRDGRWMLGRDYEHQRTEVETAIRATMADGVVRMITLQTINNPQAKAVSKSAGQGPCPKCGTYCCDDCEA